MKLHEIEFKRRFSINCYHNLKLKLVEMSFYKNWVNDNRGDPYPVLSSDGDIKESVGLGKYTVSSATAEKSVDCWANSSLTVCTKSKWTISKKQTSVLP